MGLAKMPLKLSTLIERLRLPDGAELVDAHMSDDRADVVFTVRHPDLRSQGGIAHACHSRIDGHPLGWVQEESEWDTLQRSRR